MKTVSSEISLKNYTFSTCTSSPKLYWLVCSYLKQGKTFTCALFRVQLDLHQTKTVDNLLGNCCSLVQCGKKCHRILTCFQMKSLIIFVCFLLTKALNPQITTPFARLRGLRQTFSTEPPEMFYFLIPEQWAIQ